MAEFMSMEMAELIEQGLEFTLRRRQDCLPVRETPRSFLQLSDRVYHASGMGLALIGRWGDPAAALLSWAEISNTSRAGRLEAASRLLGVSVALATLIEVNHENGLSAGAIAFNLRKGTLGLAMGGRAVSPAVARRAPQKVRVFAATCGNHFPSAEYYPGTIKPG